MNSWRLSWFRGFARSWARDHRRRTKRRSERGSYLVNTVMTCHNCHTPMGPNGPQFDKALSGEHHRSALEQRIGVHRRIQRPVAPDREGVREGRAQDLRLLRQVAVCTCGACAITVLAAEAVRLFHLARVAKWVQSTRMHIMQEDRQLRSYRFALRGYRFF